MRSRVRRPARAARGGRPPTYPDRLFLKALVIMLVRNVSTVDGLLAILEQPTPEMQALRTRLTERRAVPDAADLGAPAERRCRAPCRRGSPAWGGTWSGGSTRGPTAGAPSRSTARCCTRGAASGTRSTARPASSRTPRSTPRPTGPSPAGTAGSTAGSSTWSPPSRPSGSRWRPN